MDIFIKNKMLRFYYFFSIAVIIFGATKTNARNIYPEEIKQNVMVPPPARTQSKAEEMCKKYTTQSCEIPPSSTPYKSLVITEQGNQILGGKPAEPKEYPHMALLIIENERLCGGSLISENFVLTAAHCAKHYKSRTTSKIRLGTLYFSKKLNESTAADYPITNVTVHPDYRKAGYNDLALIEFKGLTSFSEYIRPICLNTLDTIPDQNFTAIGWGKTENGTISDVLRSVDLYPQNVKSCKPLPIKFNASTELCVGYAPGGKGVCYGDSGGPLQIKTENPECNDSPVFKQFGISSNIDGEKGCASPGSPTAFTKISNFIPWIESIVWK